MDKKGVYEYETYEVTIETVTYATNGRKGIQLTTVQGEPFMTATCNIPTANLAQDEVCIKTWSGHENTLDFLVKNKIVAPPTRTVPTGYCEAPVCKLLIE